VRQAPGALYVFDPTFNKPAIRDAKVGIQGGPYSQRIFSPSKPRICVVCQRERKGEVEQFLQKLFEGNQEPGRKCFFPHGLIKTYRLQGRDVKFFPADGPTAAAYHKAAQQALAFVTTDAERWDLAYIQVDASSYDLHGDENPYLVAKSAFLAQQIPSQEFQTETIRKRGSGLDFVLSNLALASYAKLGGTPWHLKVDNSLAHELVVGLGSASISETRLGARQRMVGVITLFTSEGRYLLGNMSNAVPFEEYGAAVLEMLSVSIERAKKDMNWQKGDEVRLVFHSFKPLKDSEANAVKALAEALNEYIVDFAFLHIAQDHEIVLFDSDILGARVFRRDEPKGEFAPARGQYIPLNKHNSILSLIGAKEVKKPTDGLPYPILLHLHRCSTFTDLDYLTKQVYIFSCHSWKSFDMARMPVTIMYSQLIARLLGRLVGLPNFSVDSIHGRLNRLRWYL
jgi:argonaute-like protein implicated in RNA metabolism and viral defense